MLAVFLWIHLVVYLFFAYADNIIKLYARPPAVSVFSWVGQLTYKLMGLEALQPADVAMPERPNGSHSRISIFKLKVLRYTKSFRIFREGIRDSFLWEIVWMVLGLTYGICSLCFIRWFNAGRGYYEPRNIDGSENTMTFGQIVAILLMALPLLATGEAYDGELSMLRFHPSILNM